MRSTFFLISLLILSGCSKVSTSHEWQHVQSLTQTQDQLVWVQDDASSQATESMINTELQAPLTQAAAVRIALLNNPDLQAQFEDIGIHKADLVQAGMFSNPSLASLFRWPLAGLGINFELDGSFPLSEFWLLPTRKKMAKKQLDAKLYEIANQVLKTKMMARIYYNQLYYAKKITQASHNNNQLFKNLYLEAQKRHTFGYMTKAEVAMVEVIFSETNIMLKQAQTDQAIAYNHLRGFLGLGHQNINLSQQAPDQISLPDQAEQAIRNAFLKRLDLQQARTIIQEIEYTVKHEKRSVIHNAQLGFSHEKSEDGSKNFGPSMGFEIPVFDQNQAQISKAQFLLRKAKKNLIALKQSIQVSILNKYTEVGNLRTKIKALSDQLIPAQNKIINFTETWNNLMQVNRLQLLNAKTGLLTAQTERLKSMRDLHNHRAELEFEMGITTQTSHANDGGNHA